MERLKARLGDTTGPPGLTVARTVEIPAPGRSRETAVGADPNEAPD